MPFVAGESLRERLRRTGRLPFGDVLRIVREVASALDYAHRQGVVHRDIKPENILLAEGHAVVADFGIARAVAVAATAANFTQVGTLIGTVAYMAPEQAVGETVDGKADQYALACVAYELLEGRAPFVGATAMAVLTQHLTAPPPPFQPRTHDALPEGTERAIQRALAKDTGDRFATVLEFADAMTGPPPLAAAPARTDDGSQSRSIDAESSPLRRAGERRFATVVATGVACYEELIERLAPEQIASLTAAVRDALVDVAAKYGGQVDRFAPDDAILVFGIPASHEDDHVRAVRATLDLHGRVRAIGVAARPLAAAPLLLRSGIHTGVVLAQREQNGN